MSSDNKSQAKNPISQPAQSAKYFTSQKQTGSFEQPPKPYPITKKDSGKASQTTKYKRKEMAYVPKTPGVDKGVASPPYSSRESEGMYSKEFDWKKEQDSSALDMKSQNFADTGKKAQIIAVIKPTDASEKTENVTFTGPSPVPNPSNSKGGSSTPQNQKKKKKSKKDTKKYTQTQLLALYKDVDYKECEILLDGEVAPHTEEILVTNKSMKPESFTEFERNRNECHSTYAPLTYNKRRDDEYVGRSDGTRRPQGRNRGESNGDMPSWFDDPAEIK